MIHMADQKTIEETEKEIVEEFSLFDSWDDKYEYIIDLGKKLPPLEDQYKIDENKVQGLPVNSLAGGRLQRRKNFL